MTKLMAVAASLLAIGCGGTKVDCDHLSVRSLGQSCASACSGCGCPVCEQGLACVADPTTHAETCVSTGDASATPAHASVVPDATVD